MKPDPCTVCGGTDLNLIDGFYYCVECGTQDTNAQETVVEHTMLGDGTFAHAATRKITQVLKDAIEMSGEWHKWHAFNFILVGLVEEVIRLGAPSGFQDRVLWIWTRYLKEFMDKSQMGTIDEIKERKERVNHKSLFEFEEDLDKRIKDNNNKEMDEEEENINKGNKKKRKRDNKEQDRNTIKVVTKGLLISIIYIALNLEKSDIQLSHIFRFIREGRISIANSKKFVPKELDLKSIPHWKNFMNCNKEYTPLHIRQTAMSLIKVLDLGKPIVPDIRKMVNNHVKELCLSKEFKNLVFSLLHQVPCDYLDIDYRFVKKISIRIPDYEGVIMSYILVALKMTFGLDDHYEIKLSEAVDNINEEENRLKSYKLSLYFEPSDRLFSFRQWSNYLRFRKTMLCKYYLPMAQQHNLDVDDHVFIEHLGERSKRKVALSDEVTMDILHKILPTDESSVIPKSEFVATLTPMKDYTEVILHYIQDPDVKLLISEDFTQYSLKYASENLKLLNGEENLIKGVNEEDKPINKIIVGNLVSKASDFSMVYVKNCENQNWLKTKPPTVEHITKIEDNINENGSDHGYDSNVESSSVDMNVANDEEANKPKEMETIEEEKEGVSIFDDPFDDIDDKEEKNEDQENEYDSFQFNNSNLNHSEPENVLERSINDEINMTEAKFNPETFDRERTIKELVIAACSKYKIPIPAEYNPREPRKRKCAYILDETGAVVPKKRNCVNKTKRGEAQKEIDKIISAYYANVEKDLLEKVSEHMKSVVKDFDGLDIDNEEDNRHNVNFDISFNDGNECDNVQAGNENKNSTVEEINNIDKSLDPSLIEAETEISDNLGPKINPNFDEKTHDISQLYIKYSQRLHFENLLDGEDPNIDKILEKKIEECKVNEPITLCANDLKHQLETANDFDDDDDDQFESEEKSFLEAKLKQKDEKLGPLIENRKEITEFKYWLRHYTSVCMRKNIDLKEKFDLELRENFPRSFSFIIKECATLLDCTAFSLYKHMQTLEQILFK